MTMLPQFTSIIARQQLDVSAEHAWSRIGSFGDAGQFLGIDSALIGEDRCLGTVRQVGDAVVEVMVGQTRTSYTYVQIDGPMAARFYHGHVGVEPTESGQSQLTWAITFDQTGVSDEQRVEEHARLTERFERGTLAMKTRAESV